MQAHKLAFMALLLPFFAQWGLVVPLRMLLAAQVKLFAQNSGSASSWRLSAESNGGATPPAATGAPFVNCQVWPWLWLQHDRSSTSAHQMIEVI